MSTKYLTKEFDNHRLVSFIQDNKSGLAGFIALHRVNSQIPAFGATRLAHYNNETEALNEALRLSRSMSYKSALAGLKYGGGKAVIFSPVKNRTDLLHAYAERVNWLNGRFITGADVGIDEIDLKHLKKISSFIVGTKSSPVYYTVLGLVSGIEACAKQVFGFEDLANRSIAIQGVGKIGAELVNQLSGKIGKIFISDIDSSQLKKVIKAHPNVVVVNSEDIYKQKVDIYAPCAMGKVLTVRTISKIRASIIAGGANDQLETRDVGALLNKLGILYAPDYVINAGGLISVVNEYENKWFNKLVTRKKVLAIGTTLKKIFDTSNHKHKPTNLIADEIAEKIFNNH